jgi:palmitoyltransferase ZDHHC13/17
VHTSDAMQLAPLHHAASCPTGAATIQLLLQHAANVDAAAAVGSTPLACAARRGLVDNAKVLLAAGADALRGYELGCSCLHLAVQFGRTALVALFIKHGVPADHLNSMVSVKCLCCSQLPLLMVCKEAAITKLLLAAGADAKAVTSKGDTALHVAARHNCSVPIVCLLIKAGTAISATNHAGKTAAQVAHVKGNVLIEQLLNRAAAQQQQQQQK